MMKKVELNHTLFEEIPIQIIWDILSRLPTKTCMNCKLVCKEWYRIIIDPEFVDLRSCRRSYFTIWFRGRREFQLLELDKSSHVDEKGNLNVNVDAIIELKSNLSSPQHVLMSVVNECNGLICFKSRVTRWSPYIIINLLTGQQVIVEQTIEPLCSVEDYGLGCCPVSRKFKVLRIIKIGINKISVASIQTLGSNEWRVIGDALRINRIKEIASAPFLHGLLHRYSYKDNRIWSFLFSSSKE